MFHGALGQLPIPPILMVPAQVAYTACFFAFIEKLLILTPLCIAAPLLFTWEPGSSGSIGQPGKPRLRHWLHGDPDPNTSWSPFPPLKVGIMIPTSQGLVQIT